MQNAKYFVCYSFQASMHGFKSERLLLETSFVYLTLYLVCFPPNMVSSSHAQANNQGNSTSGGGSRASYRTTFPGISALRSLFVGAGLQTMVAPRDVGQGGREMPSPRPYVTNPFHSSCAITIQSISIYIYIEKCSS